MVGSGLPAKVRHYVNTASVVESPAKARTIRTWLGREYRVLACYGHVVELPAKKGSVDPDADFAMVCAETGKRAVRAIAGDRGGAQDGRQPAPRHRTRP